MPLPEINWELGASDGCGVVRLTPAMPAPGGWKQEDQGFRLSYIAKLSQPGL